jgi:hypothetical protein
MIGIESMLHGIDFGVNGHAVMRRGESAKSSWAISETSCQALGDGELKAWYICTPPSASP